MFTKTRTSNTHSVTESLSKIHDQLTSRAFTNNNCGGRWRNRQDNPTAHFRRGNRGLSSCRPMASAVKRSGKFCAVTRKRNQKARSINSRLFGPCRRAVRANLSCSSGPNANRQLFSPQVSEQQTTVMALVEIADVRFHIATAVQAHGNLFLIYTNSE